MRDDELMQLHVQVLYRHDEQSRLIAINDWQGGIAPRFFLGRTNQGNVWRFRHDLPQSICQELTALCQTEPAAGEGRPRHEAAYVGLLAALAPVERIWAGPAYWFAKGATAVPDTIILNESNASLLAAELKDWLPDIPHQQPFVAMLVGGQAAAICASVRITAAAHEAGVEIAASHRRKGYAAAVVSSWACEVEKLGAIPLYSTSFENIASQRVASRLGLAQFGTDFHIT